ncbi:MAG: lysylphosphatidylglycerol synthase transmembrane domain-containing protein, partial [Ilumatobacteraceae bacterium]
GAVPDVIFGPGQRPDVDGARVRGVTSSVSPPSSPVGNGFARRAGFAVAALLAAAFVVANRAELPAVWKELRTAETRWLIVGLVAMLGSFVNLGAMHAAAQRAVGVSASSRQLILTAMSANSLNLVVKSGGMAGLATLIANGRRRNVPRGSVIAAYVLVVTLAEVAFAALLIVALGIVAADGRLTTPEAIASGVFACYLGIRVAIVVVAWRSRATLRAVFGWPSQMWARMRNRTAPERSHESADHLHDALQLVRAAPSRVLPTTVHALIVDLIGVIELWSVCHAIGSGTTLAAAFVGYIVAVLFTIISVLPGGLGFVELSLGAVLVSFGATAVAAAAVVVVYRLFELWLPLIAGGLATVRVSKRNLP